MTSGSGGSKMAPVSAPVSIVGGEAVAAPARRSGSPAPITSPGFQAQLTGASLWDLVQMECLARSRRVVQVSGEGGVGYLYFSGGRVVHAVTRRSSGEGAALEILSWTNGSFRPSDRAWPQTPTIDVPHEALILQAAKRLDDAAASNLVAFRGRGEVASAETATMTEAYEIEIQEIDEGDMGDLRNPTNNNDSQSPTAVPITSRGEHLPDFSVMIRVAANGAIIKNKGGSEELAGVVAYAGRLVELIGDLLGLERFVAMECAFKEVPGQDEGHVPGRCLLFTEANGDAVVLRPRPDSNIQPLRESLGL